MTETINDLLRKAILTVGNGPGSGDFGGPGQAATSIEQATEFIELMTAGNVLLSDVRTVSSNAAKWTEPLIEFAGRIMRPGVEANRLDYTQRAKPVTSQIEIDTTLLRGEVPVSDEVFEDNVAGEKLRASLSRTIADRAGYDIEELLLLGDESSADPYIGLLDGWLVKARAGGNTVDGSSYDSGRDYQAIFKSLLKKLPQRWLRNIRLDGRYYVPMRLEIEWRDVIAGRGTSLGDISLTSNNDLVYQGIKITGVPTMEPEDDTDASILLTNRNNLIAGFHRNIRFETFRDPREGVTSFLVNTRCAAEVQVPEATAIADGVDISD